MLSRDDGDSSDLAGLDPIEFGVEVGGFAEVYPTDWLRVRGEIRRGFRAHEGVVGDVAVDAFADITPEVRVSGGPRVSFGFGRLLRCLLWRDRGRIRGVRA